MALYCTIAGKKPTSHILTVYPESVYEMIFIFENIKATEVEYN